MLHTNLPSDEQLIHAYMQGDSRALETVINRYKTKVFTAINLLVRNRYTAEEIFQELFIKVINTLNNKKYEEEGKFISWLMRIAHNMCMDHFRKTKTAPVIKTSDDDRNILNDLAFSSPSADHRMVQQQRHERVRMMLDQLPEEQREVIILRHYANLNFKDIAVLNKCSINTVLGRMRYGLINLRKMMAEKQLVM
jgi:RNA polymerase sigma factor (sigma-70 family)